MKKFIVIYYSPVEAMAKMATMTPEEATKGMEPWMTWNAKVGDKMVDLGAPLMRGHHLNAAGNWTGGTTEVSGYSILQGENFEDVKTLLENHPHLSWHEGCTIAVHEAAEMG